MIEEQPNIPVTRTGLVAKVQEMRDQGYRLVQIGATPLKPGVEVNYSFDRAGRFVNLRLSLAADDLHIPSISAVYWCAFIYENELHDLFDIQVEGMALDFKGHFYKIATPHPYAPAPAIPAPAVAPGITPPASKDHLT